MTTLNERLRATATRPVEWIEQGAKFLLVGLINTGIDLGLYYLLTRYVATLADANVLAKGISYTAGVVNSYLLNRSWTFAADDRSWRTFAPFVLTNLIGMSLNAAVLWLALMLSLPEISALLLATAVVFIWNFTVSKFLVFRQ